MQIAEDGFSVRETWERPSGLRASGLGAGAGAGTPATHLLVLEWLLPAEMRLREEFELQFRNDGDKQLIRVSEGGTTTTTPHTKKGVCHSPTGL